MPNLFRLGLGALSQFMNGKGLPEFPTRQVQLSHSGS
jgi:hypothetical protein